MLALRGFATVQRWHPEVLVSRVCWFNIASMHNFDSKFWNLSQAAAWVVFRNRKLVEQFSKQSANNWRALLIYPKMHEYTRVGDLDDLVNALIQGNLTAWGRRNDIEDKLEAIPAIEWTDLTISPPVVTRAHSIAGQIEPWIDLRFESSILKKLWRSLWDTEGRTRYDWEIIRKIWQEINERLPDATTNGKIEEVQGEFNVKFGDNTAPSRSAIQNHIKLW